MQFSMTIEQLHCYLEAGHFYFDVIDDRWYIFFK